MSIPPEGDLRSPFRRVVVRLALRTPYRVDHVVDDSDAHAVTGHGHGAARHPHIAQSVVHVEGVGVHVAIRRVVTTAHHVHGAAHDTGAQPAARRRQVRQALPLPRFGVEAFKVAQRLSQVAAGAEDDLRGAGLTWRIASRLVQFKLLQLLRQRL